MATANLHQLHLWPFWLLSEERMGQRWGVRLMCRTRVSASHWYLSHCPEIFQSHKMNLKLSPWEASAHFKGWGISATWSFPIRWGWKRFSVLRKFLRWWKLFPSQTMKKKLNLFLFNIILYFFNSFFNQAKPAKMLHKTQMPLAFLVQSANASKQRLPTYLFIKVSFIHFLKDLAQQRRQFPCLPTRPHSQHLAQSHAKEGL